MKPVREVFEAMLRRACRQAGVRPRGVAAGCFGLCGCDLPEDRVQLLRHAIGPLGLGGPSVVHNDAFIALFNDRWRDDGLVITSGSWHKWLGVRGRRTWMHDATHLKGLREMVLDHLIMIAEGFRGPDSFSRALSRHLGYRSSRDYLTRWLYGQEKRSFVGRVTPGQQRRARRIPEWLSAAARRGSVGALRLLDGYAAVLAEGAGAIVRVLGLRRHRFDVVLSGSVLAGLPDLRRLTARRIRRFAPGARCVGAPARPVRGALVHAAHEAWGGFSPAASGRALLEPELWYGPPPSTAAY
jgi:hypothetical protein